MICVCERARVYEFSGYYVFSKRSKSSQLLANFAHIWYV